MVMLHRSVYCTHCGWNIPTTSKELRVTSFALMGVCALGLLFMFLALERGKQGSAGALLIGVPFFFLPATLVLVARIRIARLARVAAGEANAGDEDEASVPSTVETVEPAAERLRFVSRPRTVTMTWKGRFYTILVLAGTAFTLWLLSIVAPALLQPAAGSLFKLLLGVAALGWWLWSCFSFLRNRIRERGLLVNGELANGVVMSRSEERYGPYIVYGFRSGGQNVQTRCLDFSNDQFQMMPLHVFYDPLDPSRNVALESSPYRIR